MTRMFFNAKELAQRWRLSPSTLERWRWLGVGPKFIKIGGRVRYHYEDIEQYESTDALDLKRRQKMQHMTPNARGNA